jgi:uncharacterized protein (DUF433 family)
MPTSTTSRYVVRDAQILGGEPIITGTRTPVRAIVELWRLGVAPEEIPSHLPQLTAAQVFDALSFYSDNQAEIGAFIERNAVPDSLVGTKRPRPAP